MDELIAQAPTGTTMILRALARFPERTAFAWDGGSLTYRATLDLIGRLQAMKDSFDVLYAEGTRSPKMMSIGLHCRLVGRPSRAATLARFLDYVASRPKVWVATREEIARHWLKVHPAA